MPLFRIGPTTVAPLIGAVAAAIQVFGQLVAAQLEGREPAPAQAVTIPQRSSSSAVPPPCHLQAGDAQALQGCAPQGQRPGEAGLTVLSSR